MFTGGSAPMGHGTSPLSLDTVASAGYCFHVDLLAGSRTAIVSPQCRYLCRSAEGTSKMNGATVREACCRYRWGIAYRIGQLRPAGGLVTGSRWPSIRAVRRVEGALFVLSGRGFAGSTFPGARDSGGWRSVRREGGRAMETVPAAVRERRTPELQSLRGMVATGGLRLMLPVCSPTCWVS